MIFSKASRLPVLAGLLCLLLMGFAGASYGAVRFDVVPSPTEVINTARSDVTGSINLVVFGTGNVTGTANGGDAQIGVIYTNPAMQVDNTTTSGVKIFFSSGFVVSGRGPSIVSVENKDINGRCSGFLTLNLPARAEPAQGDFIRVEGVRGRIDASLAITPGTDLYADLQSINDPAANSFTPDRVRVAKSLDGMNVKITPDTLLLCFPTTGKAPAGTAIPSYSIVITEGFARAFVDADSNNDGIGQFDRVDSGSTTPGFAVAPAALGDPTNSTQFVVWLDAIPSSVASIAWANSTTHASGAFLRLVSSTFDATSGVALGYYSYEAVNQTNVSDIQVETFTLAPLVTLKVGATATGTINAGVTLAPAVGAASGCAAPSATPARPRFLQMYESDDVATNNPPDDPLKPYAQIIRCNCYLLFTYVTVGSGYDTGIAIANTTGDTLPFGVNDAPDQLGKVSFYFYDKTAGYVGTTTTTTDVAVGRSYVNLLSAVLPTGVTTFSGYVISKADFQFCHGYAYLFDIATSYAAQGYLANVIPDPAIKNLSGRRAPAAAADITNLPAGESLNN